MTGAREPDRRVLAEVRRANWPLKIIAHRGVWVTAPFLFYGFGSDGARTQRVTGFVSWPFAMHAGFVDSCPGHPVWVAVHLPAGTHFGHIFASSDSDHLRWFVNEIRKLADWEAVGCPPPGDLCDRVRFVAEAITEFLIGPGAGDQTAAVPRGMGPGH